MSAIGPIASFAAQDNSAHSVAADMGLIYDYAA